jgi:hypothetical protein
MSYSRTFLVVLAASGLAFTAGCSAPDDAASESSSQDLVGDIASMTARGDGSFDVTCKDGVKEIATASSISEGKVCARAAAGECSGTPITAEQALALIPAGKTEVVLSRFDFKVRAPRDERGSSVWDAGLRWYDLDGTKTSSDPVSNFHLYVRVKDGYDSSRDRLADIPLTASFILKVKDGVAYAQIVTDAATIPGTDTTQLARVVSNAVPATSFAGGFDYKVETGKATPGGDVKWEDRDYRASLESQYYLHFTDGSGMTQKTGLWSYIDRANSILTQRCVQIRYVESSSNMASQAPALRVSASFSR